LTKRSISKGVIKDLVIVGMGLAIIWVGVWATFGVNPFYVVASGSMIPALNVYDVLIVQGAYAPFEEVQIGDIIVFDRPSGHDRVIVHRVVSITDDDPRTLRTKGDNNVASIPGTDFPITEKEYIGTVQFQIPQIGFVTQILKPPTNYILIVVVIGFMIVREIIKKRKVKELAFTDPLRAKESDALEGYSDLEALEKDSAYSEHADSGIPDHEPIKSSQESKDNEKKSTDTKD